MNCNNTEKSFLLASQQGNEAEQNCGKGEENLFPPVISYLRNLGHDVKD